MLTACAARSPRRALCILCRTCPGHFMPNTVHNSSMGESFTWFIAMELFESSASNEGTCHQAMCLAVGMPGEVIGLGWAKPATRCRSVLSSFVVFVFVCSPPRSFVIVCTVVPFVVVRSISRCPSAHKMAGPDHYGKNGQVHVMKVYVWH